MRKYLIIRFKHQKSERRTPHVDHIKPISPTPFLMSQSLGEEIVLSDIYTNPTQLDIIQSYFKGWPIKLKTERGKGRFMVATSVLSNTQGTNTSHISREEKMEGECV